MITNKRFILNIKCNTYEPKYTILDTKDGVQEDWFLSDIPKNVDIFGLSCGTLTSDIIIPYGAGIIVLGREPSSRLYAVAIFTDNTSVVLYSIEECNLRTIISSRCFKIYGFKYDYYKYCDNICLKLTNSSNEIKFNYSSDIQLKYATMSKDERAKLKILYGIDNNLYTTEVYEIDNSSIEECGIRNNKEGKHWLMWFNVEKYIERYDSDGKYSNHDISKSSSKPDYDDSRIYSMSEIGTIVDEGLMKHIGMYINNIIEKSNLGDILDGKCHSRVNFSFTIKFTIKDSFYFDGIQKFTGL